MQLLYDEDFVEAVVVLCASGRGYQPPALQLRRFHHERERLYRILDPDERNTAFFRLYLEWFREWGREQLLIAPLSEFPLLGEGLSVLAFRQAQRPADEGAELYVNPATGRHGVMALRASRWEQPERLAPFLRHELTHLHDMVDPAFGYAQELPQASASAMEQRLLRERYRVLWDVTIDGRLTRAGHPTLATRAQRQAEFDRAYNFWPADRRAGVFDSLWQNTAPTHGELLALVSDPRDLRSTHAPVPGGLCPLCGFPTFAWEEPQRLPPPAMAAIRAEFPAWSAEEGLCNRCAELYRARLTLGG